MIALDNGFQEAVGIVADLAGSVRRLCAATGYRILHEGVCLPAALRLLGCADGASGQEVLMGHRTSERGHIRLIALHGHPAGLLRDGAQAWDVGGIFDINVRALPSIDALHHRMGLNGFVSAAPITDWDFGPVAVREVVERDADGLCIALMERVSPPLTGFEGVPGPASWVFNSTQTVADFDAARAIFVDALGWQVVQESEWIHESGLNCMGLPFGLAPQVPVRVGIYHPRGVMDGSVEIIAFGCAGLDFSAAAPPLRGWASLRFPVADLGSLLVKAEEAGCRTLGPVAIDWQPYGRGQAGALITPWGARLEAFQLA